MYYINDSHKANFLTTTEKARKSKNSPTKYLACVYLLSADSNLWKEAIKGINDSTVNFDKINIKNIGIKCYTICKAAQDIYCGTNHFGIGSLTDSNVVSDSICTLIIHAIQIIRHEIDFRVIIQK